MRTLLAVIVFGLVAAGSCQDTFAHTGDRVFGIMEIPTSALPSFDDGTISDWLDVVPESLLMTDFHSLSGGKLSFPAEIDPKDFTFRVFLAWHYRSQRILVALGRVDDEYIDEFTYTVRGVEYVATGAGDEVLIGIDGDHSGGIFNYFAELDEEEQRLNTASQAQLYSAIPTSPDGEIFTVDGFDREWATESPWGESGGFAGGESPHISGVEVALTAWDRLSWEGPESSERSELFGGKVIGFQLWIQDMDEEPPAAHYFLTEWELVVVQADAFGDAELIPCFVEDCSGASGTLVENSSWAYIKSSFRDVDRAAVNRRAP